MSTTRVGFLALVALSIVAFSSCHSVQAHSSPITRILHATRGPHQQGYVEPTQTASSTGSTQQSTATQSPARLHPVDQHGGPLGPRVRMRL